MKEAEIHTSLCERCKWYYPIEVDDIKLPDDEYRDSGKIVRTLASDNTNKKLTQTDLENILQSFRSPKGKGGGKHGKRKQRKRYEKKEDY